MFTLYSAYLRHAGKRSYEIKKSNLTAPEIIVLRAIHGADSVVGIQKTGKRVAKDFASQQELLTNQGELDRLRQIYRDFTVDDDKPLLDAMWPGYNPQLPTELSVEAEGASVIEKELA